MKAHKTHKFVIVITEIKEKKLTQPIVRIVEHELDEINTIDYLCERLYEEVVDEFDLYHSDEVFVLPENKG